MINTLKKQILELLFPIGSTQRILTGYLKGKQIKISENSQWAPLFGRWEPAMQKLFLNTQNPGNIFYDIGANFGLHGLLCSRYLGSNGHIYNFDPLRSNLIEIEENYKLNKIINYTNIPMAISNKTGTAYFNVAKHDGQGSLIILRDDVGKILVKTITLDDFIKNGNPLPNYIKMDIEGSEGDALEGFVNNIEKAQPIMIIELHSPEADKKVGSFLKFYNYSAYRFDTFKGLKFEKVINLENPFPDKNGIWGTVLCLPASMSLNNFKFLK